MLIVPLSRLTLHEAHDGKRLELLAGRIRDEAVQRNPVIISPQGDGFLVLDGAHRVQALKNIECEFVLAQEIEPPERAESWGHILSLADRSKLYEIEGVSITDGNANEWLAGIEFADGEKLVAQAAGTGLAGDIEGLWSLQKLYPDGGMVHRVDPGARAELEESEAVIRYRPFSPDELAGVVSCGGVLPAGITRFRARERVLEVRFPLAKLMSGELAERNADLRTHVDKRWRENRVRYYSEPVVLFE